MLNHQLLGGLPRHGAQLAARRCCRAVLRAQNQPQNLIWQFDQVEGINTRLGV